MSNSNEFLQSEFDDHPSLASLDDYEPSLRNSPAFEMASQHSGFRSNRAADSDYADSDSTGPWSPPAWRRPPSGWLNAAERLAAVEGSAMGSRQTSPAFEEDADITIPTNVPLPRSPDKRSLSPSPGAVSVGQAEVKTEDERENSPPRAEQDKNDDDGKGDRGNYFRFALRAEVQQRTEPIEAVISFLRWHYRRITSSRSSVISFVTVLVLVMSILRALFETRESEPGPDLVKVAGLARSFEPLIQYSENGALQIGDLQETGVAVWDLGETVRHSNMTSSPIIVKELDDLSESLKTLALELTRFFANVDGDVDSILIVMDWAKRELNSATSQPPSTSQSLYTNLHTSTHRLGGPKLSSILTSIFGAPHSARAKATLQRTFTEFLNVLEESINAELHYSTLLFALFEAIDRQFLNLQRTVLREADTQEAEKERADSELADLWRRAVGGNKSRIHKFERNRALLESIRGRTVRNKLTLVEHNGKLLKLKANLEMLRRRLVSPLVRANDSSTLSVEEQIRGLDGTYEYLKAAREKQKSMVMERLYGAGRRSSGLPLDGPSADGRGVDARASGSM